MVVVVFVRADDQKYGNKATAITALEMKKKEKKSSKLTVHAFFFFHSFKCIHICACLCVSKPICCIKSTEFDDGVGAFGSRLKCLVYSLRLYLTNDNFRWIAVCYIPTGSDLFAMYVYVIWQLRIRSAEPLRCHSVYSIWQQFHFVHRLWNGVAQCSKRGAVMYVYWFFLCVHASWMDKLLFDEWWMCIIRNLWLWISQ